MPVKMKFKHIFTYFFILSFLAPVLTQAQGKRNNKFVVVLDAGHGGHDPGKPSKYGYNEKDVALKLVLQIGSILEKRKDIKVIYTRKTDVFLKLRERARIANQADADLFVSIHCNAHTSQAEGTETYVLGAANTKRNFDVAKQENEVIFLEENFEEEYKGYDPNKPESMIGLTLIQEDYVDQSILLASLIEDNFVKKSKRKSRGVKQASLWVMHNTYMPSVLVETGFVTNRNEGPYLKTKKGQLSISNSVADAIVKYKSSLDQNVETTIKTKQKTEVPVIDPTEQHEIKPKEKITIIEGKVKDSVMKLIPEKNISKIETFKITYRVQIAAGSRAIAVKPSNFKGLKDVRRFKIGGIHKYYYGQTSDYTTISKYKEEAVSKGYSKSFVVAFKNDKPIPVKEALKLQKEL